MGHHPTVVDLGPAITAVNVRVAGFGTLPDGTRIVFAIANGYHATFSIIEVPSGRRVFSKELFGTTLGSWITQVPGGGDIYFSARHPTPAALYRFEVHTMTLHHIEDRVGGEELLFDGAVDRTGRVWFGTYPHAKVMAYLPDRDCLVDHGPVTPEATHACSIGVVEDRVWVGTGPTAHLYEIDPVSGDQRELCPPPALTRDAEWITGIAQRNSDVLVRFAPGNSTAVFHLRSHTWSDDLIENTRGGPPSPVSADGTTYLLADGPRLIGYHTHQHRLVDSPSRCPALPPTAAAALNTYALGVVRVPEFGLSGQSVVGLTTEGSLWFSSITTGQTRVRSTDIMPTTAEPRAMGTGPDGHVYVSSYLGSGIISRVNEHTLERSQLRGPHESDAIISHGDRLAISSCPGPQVHLGDPDRPWEWGVNPWTVLEADADDLHFQERIVALASVEAVLAVGTVGPRGRLGGTLAFLDPRTGSFTAHRRVVADQGIVALTHRDGLVYGATSIHGWGSPRPRASRAQLFIWDTAAEAVVWSDGVGDGVDDLGGLTWGPEGHLVGTTSGGELFWFDVERRAVTEVMALPLAGDTRQLDRWGHAARTVYDPASDSYLLTRSGHLVQVERSTLRVRVVSRNLERITRAGNGRLFALDETNLYLVETATSTPVDPTSPDA